MEQSIRHWRQLRAGTCMSSAGKPKRPEYPVRYRIVKVGDHHIRVAGCRLPDAKTQTPLLIFNGIGASAEMLEPLLLEIGLPVLTFDMPGIGGSSPQLLPRRMSQLATLATRVLDALKIPFVHVMGISWGGGLAQQFAYQYGDRCSGLILAATTTGHLMVPPKLSVLLRMATPLRYYSSRFFKKIAGDIYGGDFRRDRQLTTTHSRAMAPPTISGYVYQLYAAMGWTSLFWLHRLKQETLIMAGTDDPIIRPINAQILASRIPNSTLKTFDCGHLFILTRMQESVLAIRDFLSETNDASLPGRAR